MNRRTSSSKFPDDVANNEWETLYGVIDEIEKILEPLEKSLSDSSRAQTEHNKVLHALQEEIRNLKVRAETLVTNSVHLGDIGLVETRLVSIKGNPSKDAEVSSLEDDKQDTKKRLQSVDGYELASLRKEISKIKERAESLVTKESWLVRLGKGSVLVLLGIIPLLLAIYVAYIAIVQSNSQPIIHDHATQTAVAATQTAMSSATEAPTIRPTPNQ